MWTAAGQLAAALLPLPDEAAGAGVDGFADEDPFDEDSLPEDPAGDDSFDDSFDDDSEEPFADSAEEPERLSVR